MQKPSLYSLAVSASTFSVIASDRWLLCDNYDRHSFTQSMRSTKNTSIDSSCIMKCRCHNSAEMLFCRQRDDIPGRIHKWHVPQTSSETFPLDSRVLFRSVPACAALQSRGVLLNFASSCACDWKLSVGLMRTLKTYFSWMRVQMWWLLLVIGKLMLDMSNRVILTIFSELFFVL